MSDDLWTLERLATINVVPRTVNVLAHGHIRGALDIKQLALLVRNADYKPRGFGACVIRFTNPRCSLMVYKSGKYVVLGANHPVHARTTVDRFLTVLEKCSLPHELASFNIANITCAMDVHFRIRLEGLANAHIRFCTYEPELFPGLIYRMVKPKVTLLVFVSGKIVCTGAKTQEESDEVICRLFPVLLQFRMPNEEDSDDSDDSNDVLENEQTVDELDALLGDADDEWDDQDDNGVEI